MSSRPQSAAIGADLTSGIGQRVAHAASAHPGESSVVPLQRGQDALVSRLAFIDAAKHSIDLQYYIWHDDASGVLLLDALLCAAERGVRVRLLLDDNGVPGLDAVMAALNAQDNFELRLFNPSTARSPKILGYVSDFFRMNRRMHNKSSWSMARWRISAGTTSATSISRSATINSRRHHTEDHKPVARGNPSLKFGSVLN